MLCVYCNHPIQQDEMHYVLSSLGSELLAWVMVKMKCEDIDDSHLCEKCFNTLTKQWVQIQEPEIPVHTAVVDGSDPLTKFLVKLDVDMKPVKDEPKWENSDIEDNNAVTEIDTEEASHLQKRFVTKVEHSVESQQSSDNDSTSLSSLLSDDDKQNDSESPPELSGKTLNSWTKCDWCRTGMKETTYRILPDGPEKAIIVSRTLNRDTSPKRVCNSCWHKASTHANREIRKEHREVKKVKFNNESDDSYITIPGYQRVAKSCNTCIVRECKNTSRHLMPRYLRKVLIEYYNVFVSESNRICGDHIKNYYRDWSDLKNQKNIQELTATHIENMLDFFKRRSVKATRLNKTYTFDLAGVEFG